MHGDSISMICKWEPTARTRWKTHLCSELSLSEYSPSQYHSCWLCQCLQQPPHCDATACRLCPVSVLVHMDTWELSSRSRSPQGRIQDWKKEGAQGVRGLAPKIFLANLGDFSKYLAQKELGVRPPAPPLWFCACSRPFVMNFN